jgi:hypothetical protein
MTQITGDLNFAMDTRIYSTFVQDDWQVAPAVKVLYGVRYDLYQYPDGLAGAPLQKTRQFNIDKNNVGPRAGVAWAVAPKTALRASLGIMYDQPILGGYEQALQLSGSPKAPTYTFNGTAVGAPAFPNSAGTGTLAVQSPWAVSPDFQVARTMRANVQPSTRSDFDFTVGRLRLRQRRQPPRRQRRRRRRGGRPVGGQPSGLARAAGSASTESSKCSRSATQRSRVDAPGVRSASPRAAFNVQYVAGKGLDNTPLLTQLTAGGAGPSNPSNLDRDKGRPARHAPQPLRQHRLCVDQPFVNSGGSRLLDGSQVGILPRLNNLPPSTSARTSI